MADQRKIAAGVDLLLGQRAPAASDQEDEAKIKAGAQLLLGGNQPSQTQAVIPAATPPGVPYDPDFADFVGASAESFGVGLGDSLFAAKRGFYNLTLDFILDHTDAGKELVRMSRSPREAVKEALIQNAEALPRALPSTAAVFKIEDYLTDKLKRDLASRPTEVQENLAVQVSGAMGQITGTAAQAAIPGVGVGLAMTSGAAQGFNEVYEEARQKGATMGDAVVGALPSAAAAAVLEPLGARAATSVGKVFNRWNQRSGGAVERMLDDLSKRAGTEAAKRVIGKAGEELIEVSVDKVIADAATAGLKRVPGGKALTGAAGQAAGRTVRAGAVEFFGEAIEKVLANAGVNYATEQDVSLLRGVVDEGIVGGSAGALIRSVVETIVGIRARRGAGTIINISPKVGDTPLYNEDGTPIKMSEVMSGMTPEEMATKETQVVADAAASYRDQIIASRGQKDSPRYIPETVSTRELAIVISNERKIDMALATQAAERAKSMVAERLAREPLEPVFEPTVDPTNPMTWNGLTEEQATAAYNEEYSEYLAQLEKFNQRLEKQRAVAQKFGADYLGGVDEMDELRLQASNENARYWSEMYGDPERGVRTKRGPKGEEFAIPRTTVAKLQTTWQSLFNEEYALELMEADVKQRGQVDLDTQRRNQAAIEQARANIEAYKQILAEEYRYFPTLNGLYESGAERNAWKSYFQKQRELDPARAAIQAELLRNQNESQVSPEERLQARQQEVQAAAKKRAEDVKRAEERREKVQKELLEQFPGGTPSTERKAQLDELKEYILTSYREQKRVRTEEEQAEYDAFEAALPGLLRDFTVARLNAEQARAELKELEDDIYALRKDIEKAISDRRLGTARDLQAELNEKNGLLEQKKKQAAQADVRVREARDKLATYQAKPEEPPEAPPEAPPEEPPQPPQPPSRPPTKPPAAPAAPAAPATPAAPAAPAVAPTPQVQAAPAAAAAKPLVVLEFKTKPQKELWAWITERLSDLPENEDVIDDFGQDVVDEVVALADENAKSISVSVEAAKLLKSYFEDYRNIEVHRAESTSDWGVSKQKHRGSVDVAFNYLQQLDSALEEQAGKEEQQYLRDSVSQLDAVIANPTIGVLSDNPLALEALDSAWDTDASNAEDYGEKADAKKLGKAYNKASSLGPNARAKTRNEKLDDYVIERLRERREDLDGSIEPDAEPTPAPTAAPTTAPEPQSQIDAQVKAMLNPDSTKKFVFVAEGSPQPTQSLVTGPVKVYAVKLTGAKGGMRGTLYTTDQGLSMSARRRAQGEGGVTEQQLDQYLYNRSQGKPKDPGAVVVQRRDETGQVVVERASDPADAEAVAETLASQVPQGLTTVVTPDDAVSERQARVAAESGPASAPAANATSAATRLNLPWGNDLLKSAEQVLKAAGVKSAIAPQVFSALADSAKPLSIDALVGKVPHRKAAFAGSDDTPANHRIKVAEVLSRLVEAGLVIQQTAPDGKTYSSVSVQGEQKISQENAKLVQQSQARALGPQISFDRAAQQAGKQVLASANLGQLANKVFAEGDKRGVARRSAIANSENVFLFLAQNDRELELDKDIVASVGVAPEPEPSGRIVDDDEFFLPDPSGPAEGERRARRTKLLHALRLLSESGLVGSKGSRYFLTPQARQQFSDALKQTGGGFARPSKRGTELPAAPTAEPTVGRVMPGVDVWKSRVEAALKSDPAGPFEFVSRQELSVLDTTVQETQDAIRGATDADLTRLLQSDAPVGFRRMATEMSIDPLTGMEVVSKVEAQLVRFDAKDVSRESWMVNRQLAWIEMRRRAQAASIKADLDRSARASSKYPPDRKGPYMRPRNPIKGRSMDPDMPSGYVRAPNGKRVPVFDDAGIGMTVTMEPATVLAGEPTNLADLRDAMNDVYNYIALTLTSDVGVLGIDGVYDPRSHAAVVGMTWDFGTVSHELSHGIVAWMHGRGEAGTTALVATMSKQVIDETTQLGRELYGPTVPAGGYEHEGLAEFFRIYMLSNEVAASNYPATYDWFQRSVLARDPKLAEKIADAQQMIDQYRFQGAEARSRASEVSREQRRRRVPILKRLQQSMLWTRFLQYWFSDVQSLYDMQSIAKANMVRLGKMTYEQAENDIALNSADYVQGLRSQASLLFRKWVTQHMTMADGRTPLEGGQSLDQAMLPMRGNRDDLMEYMRLMREEWLANQDEPRVSSIDPATRRTRIEALRAKHGNRIVLAHDNVHRWIKNVIGYCRANSPVFDKAFSDIDASGDTESWVPLQRLVYDVMVPAAMAEGDLRAFTDPAGATTRGPERAGVKTRATEGPYVGSRSPSFNVLEELERNLSSLVAMTHKHMMIRSILDLANNNPILRGYIHKVQGADEMFRNADRLDGDPLLSLGDNDALMNLESLRSMKDVNNDDRVLISVPVRADDGSIKLESYSVHKVVADAFGSLFPTDIVKGGLVLKSLDLIGRLSSGTHKAFATGVFKPAFQLMIGPMMDFQTVWVNGSYPMGGFKLFYDYPMRYLTLGGEAVVETFGGKFLSKGTQLERTMNVGFESQPWLVGGKQSYFKSAGLSRGQRAVRYLNIANGDLMRLFERMISFPSKVGRQLSAENAAKQAGWDGKSPLTHSQAAAFIKYYDRTAVDWKQQGRLTRTINRYVPYFGVPFAANRDFVRATSDQLKDPKKRLQFGLKMAIQAGLAMAWWVMFDDEDEVKHLSYEEKSSRIPLPVPMADGSTETLLIPKAQSEMLMFSMMQAYLESKSTTDPMFWRNRGKAWVAAQLPGFLPGPIEAGGRALDLVNEEDVRKSVIDSIMPEAGYELSRPLIDYEKFMTPSELMNNPFGTIAGQKLAEITNGAITPRKFDAIVHAVAGQSVSNFEKALVMVGLAEDKRPKSAQGKIGDVPLFGSMFAARSGITMRSPYIRTLYALQENLMRQLRASREGVLTSNLAQKASDQMRIANHEAAARNGWATVMAINYIAQNMDGLTNKQRQDMMDHAGRVAENVVVSIYGNKVAPVYDPKMVMLPGTAGPVKTIKEIVEIQQPGYQPKINLPKLFNLPNR